MKYTVEQLLAQALNSHKQASLVPQDLDFQIKVERAKDSNHGDFATNVAMLLARPCRQEPRQLAETIIQNIPAHSAIERVEVAGPGFINFFMSKAAFSQVIKDVLKNGEQFGRSQLRQGQMDFDLAKAEAYDNPVYSVQYAHARISSVLRQLQECGVNWDEEKGLSHIDELLEPQEIALIFLISRYPEVIDSSARSCEPHQLAYYLRELATGLHSYFNAVQLLCEKETLRSARLCLLKAVRQVLRNGLQLIGVSTPESM